MSALAFPFTAPPDAGTVTTVAPGVLWVRMPLPFQLDHINLWLLEDGDGWTLVDTGLADDDTRGLWQRLFSDVLGGKPIKRLICTHFHPDHMGLAGWFVREWDIALWMTLGEWLFGRMMCVDQSESLVEAHVDFYRRAGFDAEHQRLVRGRGNIYRNRVVEHPTGIHRIQAGDTIEIGGRAWTVMIGTGHAPEHACLYCPEAGLLISGDQILPRISPIVGVWPTEPDADPLGQFLDSIEQFRGLPDSLLVLPSHGLPFRGLHARLAELDHHHDARLGQTVAACTEPATAWQVQKQLFTRPLDMHQTLFAASETVAHLNHMMATGRLVREADADGVWLYRQAA